MDIGMPSRDSKSNERRARLSSVEKVGKTRIVAMIPPRLMEVDFDVRMRRAADLVLHHRVEVPLLNRHEETHRIDPTPD